MVEWVTDPDVPNKEIIYAIPPGWHITFDIEVKHEYDATRELWIYKVITKPKLWFEKPRLKLIGDNPGGKETG